MDLINKILTRTLALGFIACVVGACNPDPGKAITNEVRGADGQGKIAEVEKQLGPDDVKSFGGSDHLPIGGPLASIDFLPSHDEARFLAEYGCVDEVDCYGRGKFDRYIVKTYPDIANVRFKIPPDIEQEQKEDIAFTKQNFRRGLYFAKLIKLADGTTLFDFLTKCSKTVSPFNWAEAVYDSKTEKPYFPMQFFPVLRQDATGEEFEADILLDREGNSVTARSPAFSSSILRDADFMTKYGLSCWPSHT